MCCFNNTIELMGSILGSHLRRAALAVAAVTALVLTVFTQQVAARSMHSRLTSSHRPKNGTFPAARNYTISRSTPLRFLNLFRLRELVTSGHLPRRVTAPSQRRYRAACSQGLQVFALRAGTRRIGSAGTYRRKAGPSMQSGVSFCASLSACAADME